MRRAIGILIALCTLLARPPLWRRTATRQSKGILIAGALMIAVGLIGEAQAETLFLKCGSSIIEVDLTNSTANRYPARITAAYISWEEPVMNNQSLRVSSTINRTTGVLTTAVVGSRSGSTSLNCTKVATPSTKF